MTRLTTIHPQFVESIPKVLEEGILYICLPYRTAVHKCACGCGSKTTTPIRPTGWTLSYDGESVSLCPSIGNWGLPCQSHYWIRSDQIVWAGRLSRERIEAGRQGDRLARQEYYSDRADQQVGPSQETATPALLQRLKAFFRHRK